MSVSHCLHNIHAICLLPTRAERRAALDAKPEDCPHADCTGPRNCRKLCEDYVAMMFKRVRR